ncbi:MAG: HvfC family RiPP maturation protein [Burkholderiales bacterium]
MTRESLPDFQRYQFEFTRHIREPGKHPPPYGAEPRRMKIYNELLYNNVESFLLACFPVCRKILSKRKWRGLVREFFAAHRCRAPLFRQIPEEFLHYLQTRQQDPPWLIHLAHYEWVELALDTSNERIDCSNIAADGDLLAARPALNPVRFLLSYPYAVHKMSPKRLPKEPTHILVIRNLADTVRFIVLNPVSARLVQLLETGALTGNEALSRIEKELPNSDPAAVQRGGREILENLRREQAILGTWKKSRRPFAT